MCFCRVYVPKPHISTFFDSQNPFFRALLRRSAFKEAPNSYWKRLIHKTKPSWTDIPPPTHQPRIPDVCGYTKKVFLEHGEFESTHGTRDKINQYSLLLFAKSSDITTLCATSVSITFGAWRDPKTHWELTGMKRGGTNFAKSMTVSRVMN